MYYEIRWVTILEKRHYYIPLFDTRGIKETEIAVSTWNFQG